MSSVCDYLSIFRTERFSTRQILSITCRYVLRKTDVTAIIVSKQCAVRVHQAHSELKPFSVLLLAQTVRQK